MMVAQTPVLPDVMVASSGAQDVLKDRAGWIADVVVVMKIKLC